MEEGGLACPSWGLRTDGTLLACRAAGLPAGTKHQDRVGPLPQR